MRDSPAELDYETRDVPARTLVWVAIGVIALIVFAGLAVYGLIEVLDAEPRSWASVARDRLPPEPRLHPEADARGNALKAEQRRHLESVGWVDREAGIVHIPITHAMALTVERLGGKSSEARDRR